MVNNVLLTMVQFMCGEISNGCKPLKCIKWEIFVYKSQDNELLKHENFPHANFMCWNFNTILMGVLMGLQKSHALHGKTLYPGTSHPRNPVLLTAVCSVGCKFT